MAAAEEEEKMFLSCSEIKKEKRETGDQGK